jgi:hypothetical protein
LILSESQKAPWVSWTHGCQGYWKSFGILTEGFFIDDITAAFLKRRKKLHKKVEMVSGFFEKRFLLYHFRK